MTCWFCNKPAPSGVCLGPHPTYNHTLAITSGHVIIGESAPFKSVFVIAAAAKPLEDFIVG